MLYTFTLCIMSAWVLNRYIDIKNSFQLDNTCRLTISLSLLVAYSVTFKTIYGGNLETFV